MNEQFALGLAADSDFFDWATESVQRFFLAAEVMDADGAWLRGGSLSGNPPLRYGAELPRSAS